jgi:hypothetical protein
MQIMNKNLCVITMLIAITTAAHANSDKSKFCPLVEDIRHVSKTMSQLYAYNSKGKYFSSEAEQPCPNYACLYYTKVIAYRPELTQYDANKKILSCAYDIQYYANSGVPDGGVVVEMILNRGDY